MVVNNGIMKLFQAPRKANRAMVTSIGRAIPAAEILVVRPDGTLVEGDIQVQTRAVMENLQAVLEAAGSSWAHAVKCTCFLADMNDFAAFNEVYGSYLSDTPPARSTVQVARLPKDARVEVEVVAWVPEVKAV